MATRPKPGPKPASGAPLDVTRVTREQAFEAFCTLLAYVSGQASAPASPAVYSQASPPPDCASVDAYVRIHRAEMRAGTLGWSKCGAVRSVTAEAWSVYVARQTAAARARPKRTAPNAPPPSPANDVADELDRALGIRTAGGRR